MIGLVLILLGLGAGVVALDLLLENIAPGTYQLAIFGTVIAHVSGRVIVLLLILVAAAAAAIVTHGASVLRQQRDERRLQESATLAAFLESHRRLLTERIEELEARHAELEAAAARTETELELDRRRARRIASVADRAVDGLRQVANDVVVLPDPSGAAAANGSTAS